MKRREKNEDYCDIIGTYDGRAKDRIEKVRRELIEYTGKSEVTSNLTSRNRKRDDPIKERGLKNWERGTNQRIS